jgi:protein-S-isoprenylcysteine O-methyltransferase Ste14
MYLGVFLIWLGLAVAFRSPVASLLTVLYVIPAYLVYMRSEEAMLSSEFGPAYERYRARVGMVLPRRSQLVRRRGSGEQAPIGP